MTVDPFATVAAAADQALTEAADVAREAIASLPWCPRCLADRGDPQCCTPQRLANVFTVPAKPCGHLAGDDCRCTSTGGFVARDDRPLFRVERVDRDGHVTDHLVAASRNPRVLAAWAALGDQYRIVRSDQGGGA